MSIITMESCKRTRVAFSIKCVSGMSLLLQGSKIDFILTRLMWHLLGRGGDSVSAGGGLVSYSWADICWLIISSIHSHGYW